MHRLLTIALTVVLVVGLACGGDESVPTGPTNGSLEVLLNLTGEDLDPDGSQVSLDGGASRALAPGSPVTFLSLEPGTHAVELTGLASNCSVQGANPREVVVTAGDTASEEFNVTCTSLTGSLQVTIQTTGEDPDADGYLLSLGEQMISVEPNDVVTFEDLMPGPHEVELTDVSFNCSATTENQLALAVVAGSQTDARFEVFCLALFRELGTLGGESSGAIDVNEAGQVVGSSETASGDTHAFLWTAEGGMVDLGTLGGASSHASAINDLGQVVGWSTTPEGEEHAFLWTRSEGMTDLGTGTLGGTWSRASDINNPGQVVGEFHTPWVHENHVHAFMWTAEHGFVDMSPECDWEFCVALAINEQGHVVGFQGGEEYDYPAGWGVSVRCTGEGLMGAGWASALNDNDQAVGICEGIGVFWRAVVWNYATSEASQILPVPPEAESTSAHGMNNAGQIVGSWSRPNGPGGPLFWSDGQIEQLPAGTVCGVACFYSAINNTGIVAGKIVAEDGTGGRAAVWRVPVP